MSQASNLVTCTLEKMLVCRCAQASHQNKKKKKKTQALLFTVACEQCQTVCRLSISPESLEKDGGWEYNCPTLRPESGVCVLSQTQISVNNF